MKVIYLGSISTTDCDFPLLRSYKKKGIDFVAYFTLADWNKQSGLICVNEMIKSDTILKASEIDAFKVYESYINLDNIYIINSFHHRRNQWQSWILWIKVLIHMYKQKADIFHCVWPPSKQEKILYLLPLKRILTVHDPFPHSSGMNLSKEKNRVTAFKKFEKLVLLNNVQMSEFKKYYKIREGKVESNQLGEYDCIRYIHDTEVSTNTKYILYFGQIQSHKGVEFLLEAMTLVHKKNPQVKLIIAGKGHYYFDVKPYEGLDYIVFLNRYIPVPELANLLGECLFVVCPYKDATQSGVVQTAFSAGVPLVVTNVGNMPNEVKDRVLGLVVPPCDAMALSNAMNELIGSPNLLVQFKENIEKLWRPSMSWDPIAEKYIEMYKDLLSE